MGFTLRCWGSGLGSKSVVRLADLVKHPLTPLLERSPQNRCMVRRLGLESLAVDRTDWWLAGSFAVVATGLALVALWSSREGFVPVTALALVGAVALLVMVLRTRRGALAPSRMFLLLANDPAAWFATDRDGQVILRNPAAEGRFGTDASTILGAFSRYVLEPGHLFLRLQMAAEADHVAQEELPTPEGVLRIAVHRAGAGVFLWRVEEFRRPVETLQIEPAVPVLPTRSEGDFEDIPVPLMVFGRDGLLRRANFIARDLVLEGELRAAMFHDLFDGLGRPAQDWLADVVSARIPGGTEVLRARKAGEERYVQITLHRYDDAGKPGVIAVLTDATKLMTLEAQFVQSQKMQAIGQLAGGIAHDFNNLLTAISGHCDLLLLRHGRDDMDFADLEQIRQNANRAAALVGQLLAFSRKQTLKPELLDLEDLLSDLTHLLNRLLVEKISLQLLHRGRALNRTLRPVRADRRQLEQVVINLVVNARDAMPNGGRIVIETEPLTLLTDLHRERAVVPAGDYSLIRVIDQGVGIAPDTIKKIFEPFFTTKRVGEGTGLGLSMAYGIVKQTGGFIFADSTLGEGTVFSLYLPAHNGTVVVETPPSPSQGAVRRGAGVVLLVEDEAPVRAFASRALRLRGHTVLEAENAEEALKTLDDPALEVDVFVTDVMMPGMDGPTWVRQALLTRPNARVVFVSGYAEDILNNDQTTIPNSVFLPKPFSLNDLATTVQAQLHAPRSSRAASGAK